MKGTPRAKRFLLIGPGHLGLRVLEVLLREPGPHHYLVAGRDAEKTRRLANLAKQYAATLGQRISIEPVQMDVENIDATARTIEQLRPDLIFSAATLQSWWVVGTLPAPMTERLAPSCVGPWLPMHLTLIYELMQAVRQARCPATVVNASYPDVTHPVLAGVGLSPDVGIGNIAIPLAGVRLHLAEQYDVAVHRIQMRAVFHHYVNYMATRTGDPRPAPFHVSAWLGDPDAPTGGHTIPLDRATVFAPLATTLKRSSGPDYQHVTGATAGVVLRALLDGTELYTHAPGPHGLPGGYPVHITEGRIHLMLPFGVDFGEAVRINNEGGRFDGIDRIDGDGTVHFRPENSEPLRLHLGYDCPLMRLDETRERSSELMARFAEYAASMSVR